MSKKEVKPKLNQQIGDYLLLESIGKGSFGVVFKAINRKDKKTYAIKTIQNSLLTNAQLVRLIETEIKIMQMINHPNVIKLLDYFIYKDIRYLVMDYCEDGDLKEFLTIHKMLPERDAVHILMSILEGFRELHKNQIMHRDFKLANVLLKNGRAIIADFGFARQGFGITKTNLGTFITQAPEINRFNDKGYDNKVDIWSIGICFYQLLFGILPWPAENPEVYLRGIEHYSGEHLPFNQKIKVSENAKNLLKRMLQKNPKQRITWNEISIHPLFKIESPSDSSKNPSRFLLNQDENKAFLTNFGKNTVDSVEREHFEEMKDFEHITLKVTKENVVLEDINKKEIELQSKFRIINKLFEHEKWMVNFQLLCAQQFNRLRSELKFTAAFMCFLLVKKIQLRINKLIETLAENRNMFKLDTFDEFVDRGMHREVLNTLKVEQTKANDYLKVVYRIVQIDVKDEYKNLLKSINELKFEDTQEIEKVMRDEWKALVNCLKKVLYPDDLETKIYTALANCYFLIESDAYLAFFQENEIFNVEKFKAHNEKRSNKAFCESRYAKKH